MTVTAPPSRPVRWLLDNGKAVSEIGAVVADLLWEWADGIYHIEDILDVSFAGTSVSVPIFHSMATYDWADLTRLVILAHDRCVRVEIRSELVPYRSESDESGKHEVPALVLYLSGRVRGGDWLHGHPTIEEAIERVRGRIGRQA
mgnify:CR=1 FL=1